GCAGPAGAPRAAPAGRHRPDVLGEHARTRAPLPHHLVPRPRSDGPGRRRGRGAARTAPRPDPDPPGDRASAPGGARLTALGAPRAGGPRALRRVPAPSRRVIAPPRLLGRDSLRRTSRAAVAGTVGPGAGAAL